MKWHLRRNQILLLHFAYITVYTTGGGGDHWDREAMNNLVIFEWLQIVLLAHELTVKYSNSGVV